MSGEVQAAPPANRLTGAVAQAGGFLKAVRAELDKVTWPSRPELMNATRMIVVLSIALGIAIGLLDWVLQKILVDGVAALAR
ncbi:MAG TPA: preprotein translocase subunit SecE [Gemmatimonadales bacterium]|nr:preprotein translocase subunit SecE [Gemmatimonadales bacterium]